MISRDIMIDGVNYTVSATTLRGLEEAVQYLQETLTQEKKRKEIEQLEEQLNRDFDEVLGLPQFQMAEEAEDLTIDLDFEDHEADVHQESGESKFQQRLEEEKAKQASKPRLSKKPSTPKPKPEPKTPRNFRKKSE